jgi:hypothetical protein
MPRAGRLAQIPAAAGQQEWNVNCQAVPNAEASIAYLAPYVFKVAISEHRILKVENGCVSFSYPKPGSVRRRTLTLDALEFIRRFLTHVRPAGFMRLKLAFLKGFTLFAPQLEELCQAFGIATSTGYGWIRAWNRQGYEGICEPGKRTGCPPKLDRGGYCLSSHPIGGAAGARPRCES